MRWLMNLAAGAAIGYFLFQWIVKGKNQSEEETRGETGGKRLHKSAVNRKIAGVCGGIAEYLNTDPTIVRLATVLLTLGWGTGLLAYIVCALVMPEGE